MTKRLFVMLLLTGDIIPCTSFPYVYYFVGKNKTWEEARAYCTAQYTALAEINNMENLTTMMSTSPWGYAGKAWIGLSATLNWTWEDGQVATYFHWMPGQPDNADGNELCAAILGGLWTDDSCSQSKYSVCYDGTNILIGHPMTWINASAYCASQASSLAKITNDLTDLKVFLKMSFSGIAEAWIGLGKTQLWQWSESSDNYTFRNWQPGQPDNQDGGQNCAAVLVDAGTWTDEQCNAQHPFFCYDVYKTQSAVVRMMIRSDANLEDPASSDNLLQQLYLTFANHSVTHVKLTWQKVPVQMRETPTPTPTPTDPC